MPFSLFCNAAVDFRRAVQDRWGYWVPEAVMVVLPENTSRLLGYVVSWLQAREPWLYILANQSSTFRPLNGSKWRTYLARFPKENDLVPRPAQLTSGQRKRKAAHQHQEKPV